MIIDDLICGRKGERIVPLILCLVEASTDVALAALGLSTVASKHIRASLSTIACAVRGLRACVLTDMPSSFVDIFHCRCAIFTSAGCDR